MSKKLRDLGQEYVTCSCCETDTLCEGFVVAYPEYGTVEEVWACESCIASGEYDFGGA